MMVGMSVRVLAIGKKHESWVSEGITRVRLPAGNEVVCTLHDPRVPALAEGMGNTRSAAAIELWRPHLDGAVVAIGGLVLVLDLAFPAVGWWPLAFVGVAMALVPMIGRSASGAWAAARTRSPAAASRTVGWPSTA